MAKFTPGPWKAGRPDALSYRMAGPAFKAVYADSVQEPVDIPEVETLPMTLAECYGREPEEIHANARLIAAAPEMYELLTRVSESNVSPLRNQSRALLARIDGETLEGDRVLGEEK